MNQTNLEKLQEKISIWYYYARLRRPKHWGWVAVDEERLLKSLPQLNIPLRDLHIDVQEYKDYFEMAGYATRYPHYYPWNITEKSLEHFVAQQLLQLDTSDTYIDIASEGSPVPEIYHRLFGCTTYAQDLTYEPGIHDGRIGSNAASMPLPDGSVTKMALHCSFEHFEGESDSGFIREAARLLRAGGRLVILPLYMASRYAILTDPLVSKDQSVDFDPAAVVTLAKGWGNRYGRFYDPAHLSSRVLNASKDISFSLILLKNAKEIGESVYAQFALIGTKTGVHSDKTAIGGA